jgi:hypothetical protein
LKKRLKKQSKKAKSKYKDENVIFYPKRFDNASDPLTSSDDEEEVPDEGGLEKYQSLGPCKKANGGSHYHRPSDLKLVILK